MKKNAWLALMSLILLAVPVRAGIKLLHEFAGGAGDGARPIDSLLISGSTLYGMTKSGGGSDLGTIFKVQADGTGFTLLHSFVGGATDGANPLGSLILSGSTLFGMTGKGGGRDLGTVFKIGTNGSGFIMMHSFAGGAADGANPNGSLVLSGSTLYGMTCNGGSTDFGTIFKIGTGGTGFILLHEFSGGTNDGKMPRGSLTLSGSTLYGMTYWGGEGDNGTIFSIQSNGSGFALLHAFADSDGANPYGALTLSGTTLFGMTLYGGYYSMGTIFKMQTNGSGFALLHEFSGYSDDGGEPYGSLFLAGSTLYGMTLHGGTSFRGAIFTIGTDGGGFYPWHQFLGGADDGTWPYGSLILLGSTLYGMTRSGGDSDLGVVFSLPMPKWTVTSPNGGENWKVGSNHDISWTTDGDIAYVNIDYSINNGSAWTPVAGDVLNTGSYSWTVPDAPSTACRVRVSDVLGATNDCSDASFTISQIQDLVVTAPASTTPWEKGRTHQITWLKQGAQNAYVKISLYKGTSTWVATLAAKTANDGSFDWARAHDPSPRAATISSGSRPSTT